MLYNALSSLISTHNINKKFNMPMFGNIAIMGDPVFHDVFSYSLFSFSLPKLLEKIKIIYNVTLLHDYLNLLHAIFYVLCLLPKRQRKNPRMTHLDHFVE